LIFLCPKCNWAINKEIADVAICPKCGEELIEEKAIEVGNIFPLGTKYSDALSLKFTDERGDKKSVVMGCYGIGMSRLLGAVVEVHNDDRGILWPESVAPYKVHLIALEGGEQETDKFYLGVQHLSVLYDDREDKSAGEKFSDADLIGCPVRIIISKKTLVSGCAEVKKRSEKEATLVSLTEIEKIV